MGYTTNPVSDAKIVFAGVDGTGERNDDDYKRTFEFSFVNELNKGWQAGPHDCCRGPWWIGNRTREWANKMFEFVMREWKAGAKAVFLAGFSRGGAAAIEIAKWLKSAGVPVECLILFDPVDRSATVGENLGWRNTPIVDTVAQVIYAQRNYATKSRESFGNCGTVLQDPRKTRRHFKQFFCTHGAMGGTPWLKPEFGFIDEGPPDFKTHVTVQMDILGCLAVRDWVFDLVFDALYKCKRRLTQPNGQLPPTKSPGPGRGPRIHIVVRGDWLSKIAQTYYGDMTKWPVIHEANRDVIGNNPDLILPGMPLVIP